MVEEPAQMPTLMLSIDGTPVTVLWEDNETVSELFTAVQNGAIEVSASRYGGFEQVGSLPQSFSRNDVQTTTQPGDIVLYSGIPVQAHFLASEGIPDVLEMVKNVQNRFSPNLKIAGILLTMYQSRPQLCQSVRNSVNDIYGESLHVFERPIEQTIKVAECPAAGMSILDYAPKNPAAESYRSLALEVLHLA